MGSFSRRGTATVRYEPVQAVNYALATIVCPMSTRKFDPDTATERERARENTRERARERERQERAREKERDSKRGSKREKERERKRERARERRARKLSPFVVNLRNTTRTPLTTSHILHHTYRDLQNSLRLRALDVADSPLAGCLFTARRLSRRRRKQAVDDDFEGRKLLGSTLADDRPIMNAVKYKVVSSVVRTNRTMVSSNTYTNRTGVLAVVYIEYDITLEAWPNGGRCLGGPQTLYPGGSPASLSHTEEACNHDAWTPLPPPPPSGQEHYVKGSGWSGKGGWGCTGTADTSRDNISAEATPITRKVRGGGNFNYSSSAMPQLVKVCRPQSVKGVRSRSNPSAQLKLLQISEGRLVGWRRRRGRLLSSSAAITHSLRTPGCRRWASPGADVGRHPPPWPYRDRRCARKPFCHVVVDWSGRSPTRAVSGTITKTLGRGTWGDGLLLFAQLWTWLRTALCGSLHITVRTHLVIAALPSRFNGSSPPPPLPSRQSTFSHLGDRVLGAAAVGCVRRVYATLRNCARQLRRGSFIFHGSRPPRRPASPAIANRATVTERLVCSPPTMSNRVQSPAGSPDFCKWESCQTMPLVRLDCSPPAKANQIQSPAGSHPGSSQRASLPNDAADWWVFSGISCFPPPFHSSAATFSPRFTLIGSRDLVVKSCRNLSFLPSNLICRDLKNARVR
ncbi:hypothetical protein PR048_033559 [Dryococelus australis]|uniref:Uncharacterized protein n=1 Tax=Dryococelus australis TaxID=614101 RepID=A0ABQ9G0M0_9NEOP|nr:hypothetical protein PR048_033559 [Dryococelus australis]